MSGTARLSSWATMSGVVLCAGLLLATGAAALTPQNTDQHEQRNFDARVGFNAGFAAQYSPAQRQAVEALRRTLPDLAVTYEPTSSAVHSIYNRTGYLTPPSDNWLDVEAVAMDWVRDNLVLLGLGEADLAELEITDSVYTRVTGSTHLYLRQMHRGLPLYNGQLHINVNRDGRIISVNNAFLPGLAESVNVPPGKRRGGPVDSALDAAAAVQSAAEHLGISLAAAPLALTPERGARRLTEIDPSGISASPIEAGLMWLPLRQGDARLVWNFQIETLDGRHWYDMTVDAMTGQVWTRFDWVNSGTFRVYEQPVESPNHTTPLPPSDARTLAVDPENGTASPSGWFAGGIMDGNNVHACPDTNANNACDSNPSCSSGTCDFSINLSSAPSNSIPAAVTNLFYWNNIVHDVQYQYGFDEAGGNFQEDNFGNGGAGSDSVNADAQDGSGDCNANFATPTDGGNPRMQMFTCSNASPARDGDYDNGVIVHEYGHGISIRQVGGPGNSSCLNNNQQAGEGWSDWFALVYTAEVGDQGTDTRGVGSYLFALDPDTGTIRDLPYSTDPAVNDWTYESISGASIPHGVGSRWAQAIWEVYWALVDQYGFDPDLYNAAGGAGNQRAMLYVNEGLKNTACSPTFVDNRDGIIQAATDNYGGADVCTLWEAFAAFGLGTDAVSGGSNSTNPTNGFQIPTECQCQPNPIADAGPDQTICLGESATVGTPAQAGHSYSWAPGGETTAQITVSPSVDTTYTVTATTSCGSANDSATVFVDDGSGGAGLDDDFEGDNSDWTATGLWHEAVDSSCAGGNNGYSSPLTAFYYGQDASCTYDTGSSNTGTLTSPVIGGITSSSELSFDYYRQVESYNGNYDITSVEIVTASGSTTVFSLNSTDASNASWVSSGPISLASFAGENIQVRFRFNTVDGVANNFDGWFIDDVVVTGDSSCTPSNTAPTVTVTAPPDGTSVNQGTSINFTGTASDSEDGDLSASIAWSSSLDGALGNGASINATLSVGTHLVSASVTDSGGLSGSDSITVSVNGPPTVTINSPADGSSFESGTSVSFAGTASDGEDGDISAALTWSSNLDGAIGTGASFSTSSLSVGSHTITASVTDSGGLSASDSIGITITSPNSPPTVTITAPADGSSFDEGTSVSFTGTASDAEDGDLTASLSWSSSLDGTIGSGGSFSTSSLSVGNHTITASVTDSGGAGGSDSIAVTIDPVGGGCTDCIDWSVTPTVSYSNQDVDGNVTVEDGGDTLFLQGNTWRRTSQTFSIGPNTVLEVEFASSVQGEIHGIGFDEDDTLTNDVRIFQLHGTQNWGGANHDFDNYAGGGAFVTYTIPVGQYYTGTMFLVTVNDNDAGSGHDSRFRNVRVFEDTPPPGSCAADVDFEGGSAGWSNSGASTCSTGDFVVGAPTEVVNGGVTTQLAGDHTPSGTNAFFSAVNTSAGVNDVDGGNCIVTSPVYPVGEASDVSVWYYHGQRDQGDDPSGDFFLLEMSTDGGSSWTTLRSIGDVTTNAAWTNATASVAAGTDVQFRIQVSDGSGPGDLVEAGIDDVSICPQ